MTILETESANQWKNPPPTSRKSSLCLHKILITYPIPRSKQNQNKKRTQTQPNQKKKGPHTHCPTHRAPSVSTASRGWREGLHRGGRCQDLRRFGLRRGRPVVQARRRGGSGKSRVFGGLFSGFKHCLIVFIVV